MWEDIKSLFAPKQQNVVSLGRNGQMTQAPYTMGQKNTGIGSWFNFGGGDTANPAAGIDVSKLSPTEQLRLRETGLAESMAPWQKGLGAVNALGGLYSLYQGKKALDLEKDKFGFQKRAAGEDYGAKAKAYNEELNRTGDVGLALAGSSLTPEQKAAAVANRAQYALNPNALK